jgi:hypothetical protein
MARWGGPVTTFDLPTFDLQPATAAQPRVDTLGFREIAV